MISFASRSSASQGMTPQSLGWFARHELLLAWRDWLSMMTAGRRTRERIMIAMALLFTVGLHALAYSVLNPALKSGSSLGDKMLLVTVMGCGLLSFFMMLSQALESVTRAFYTRSDLELILSSPSPPRHVFAVRIAALTITTTAMSMMLMAPFINVAVFIDHPGWLAAYPVLVAIAMIATGIAVWLMMVLFRLIGAARTRLAAQIVAAVIGASFLIGIQVIAIFSYNNLSRLSVLQDHAFIASMPAAESSTWLPVWAATGSFPALFVVLATAAAFLVFTVWQTSKGFAQLVLSAASVSDINTSAAAGPRPFRTLSSRQALRAKEWQLLKRDPWLVSQTLMQVLYLLPPALLLWKNYGDAAGISVILAPVLVMALGQLAGGLSWLTISGEDAPELVGTAPVSAGQILWAKIEAVLAVIAAVGLPLVLIIATFAPYEAIVTAIGVGCSAASAIAIQLWFRGPAKRAHFRYRQTASRVATLAEAFSSLMWAGATALFAAGMMLGIACVMLALLVLLTAWLMS
ncbi:MAG: ABC-2 type transport system permease protein [Hyphomicrobiaceae bacterium]|jgi:ABC-2 type transport system permease protein